MTKTLCAFVSISVGCLSGGVLAEEVLGIAPKTNRIIIKYKQSTSKKTMGPMSAPAVNAQPRMLATAAGEKLNQLKKIDKNKVIYTLGEQMDVAKVEAIAASLGNDSRIEYAEPDYIMTIQQTHPNDPRYAEQWSYHSNDEITGGMNLPDAWSITQGSQDVVVAVVDTGIRYHEDLMDNIVPGYDFISDEFVANDGDGRDDNPLDSGDFTRQGECGYSSGQPVPSRDETSSWHGTHVAGTIAAVSNNGIGVAGVAWKSKILPVRVLGRCGGYTSDIVEGMRWAAGLQVDGVPANKNPAQVVNLSLGGEAPCSRVYQEAIEDITEKGTTVVVAAGNEGVRITSRNAAPANCSGVITVAANNKSGERSYYSNYGDYVDVAAPGGETKVKKYDYWSGTYTWQKRPEGGILSTLNAGQSYPGSDNYDYYQGTSMATPHVAGLVALMYAVNPKIKPSTVRSILKSTARQTDCDECGAGVVDAYEAVKKAKLYY